MKRIDLTLAMAAVLALAPAQAAQWEGPQAEAPETKDRLSPELMDQLVERPMWLLRHKGLAEAQKAFEELVAAAVKAHGKGSVREADLLESFGVLLYGAGDGDGPIRKAALAYLERAVPAYRAAFAPRHPEVAVALNSYADVALSLKDPTLRPAAVAALEEALAIRIVKLGPANAETKATVQYLERARKPLADALDEAAAAVDAALEETATATAKLDTGELVVADDNDGGFWKPTSSYIPLTGEFIADLKKLEPGVEPPKRAVAAKYGLSVEALTEGMSFLRAMEKSGYDRQHQGELRTRALAWLKLSNRAPVALAFIAGALDRLSDDRCTPADVDLLLRGSRDLDMDLWLIASVCVSSGTMATAIDRSTRARPALLYFAMDWTSGEPATELAAIDTLLRPELLAQVAPADRDRVEAEVARDKLVKLLNLGLLDEALAFGDGLKPAVRALVFKPKTGASSTSIGGFDRTDSSLYGKDLLPGDYAAALALAGRAADARAMLDRVAPRARLKELRSCLEALKSPCPAGEQGDVPFGALIVDQLLEDPSADPYVLVEGPTLETRSAAMTDALCRLLTRPAERTECAAARAGLAEARAGEDVRDADDRAFWAAIARAGGQPFETARAGYAARLAGLGGPPPITVVRSPRASVDPAPVPFRELPVPPGGRTAAPSLRAALPKGFALIRAERSGKRAVAVSLSTRFDPNGEVSGGGYWVHLSDDGGKSWGPPLYTGLAEHFPYIVPAKSRLPMIAGDRLHLEVEEALIDTATITYPPVGLHVRRKRSGIYLDIPLADLGRDSDGDGLTDIAARHLLLDEKRAGPTPFVVGRDRDCSAPNPETLARLAILEKLFEVEAQALIEPPDKKTLVGDWRRIQPSGKPPIFLRGNPDDWRCVTLDRPMVVYSEADQERLRKFSPDFQLITLPPIRWNRAHTRGFVSWSMGWTGGTYRLVRTDQGWDLKSIASWIT